MDDTNNESLVKKEIDTKSETTTSELQKVKKPLVDDEERIVGKLELLEERAVINKERLDVGKITATKHIRTKTVNVPIELVEEVLVIDTEYYDADSKEFLNSDYDSKEVVRLVEPTLDAKPVISVNGNAISLDDGAVELVISRQFAVVQKETRAVQDITISKSLHTHKDSIEVELKREELDVMEEGLLDNKLPKT